MSETSAVLPTQRRATGPRFSSPAGWLWSGILRRLAARIRHGALTLHLPGGGTIPCGDGTGPRVEVTINTPAVARRLLAGGDLGLAEAYADGWWDTPDLTAFLDLCLRNEVSLRGVMAGTAAVAALNRVIHRRRANTRRGSRRNIAAHYDLGNGFYREWLDAGMMYSSALYRHPGQTLEQAQDEKLDRAAALLDLTPGMTVLEIGCGWGGMAERLAARHGANVTGITLSREQRAYAAERLGDRAEIRLQDYRDVTGTFDRIVSLEMIEAVGEEHWPRYFATLRDRLAPGGVVVLQAITIDDARFPGYRRGCDFIQRHIFPGGMLPCPAAMGEQAARAGLIIDHVEMFGASYARTLAEWRHRFDEAWPRIAAQDDGTRFDARFRRLWDYYLSYCEAGFRAGTIDVGFWRLRRSPEEA